MATITKTPRNTDFWLNDDIIRNEKRKSPNEDEKEVINGPGYYNVYKSPYKESFNYGRVPFGTGNT
jgi:hypothetical protein